MNYVEIYTEDYVNGPGSRVSLFVSGCSHGCVGCHNEATQNPKMGKEFGDEELQLILTSLETADGFTISGGDPLFKRNIDGVTSLIKTVREHYPEMPIWVWTGYTFDEVRHLEMMKYIDVLVDGKYDKDLQPVKWRGSSNQNLIQVKLM